MYTPFSLRKRAVHGRVYKITLTPKNKWELFPSTAIFIPYFGYLTTKKSETGTKLFSFYYTLEDSMLKIENIKYINQSVVFAKPTYKDLYYEYLFDAIIEHFKNCPHSPNQLKSLFVSSTDAFSVEQMINRGFSIRKRPLSEGSALYTGIILNDKLISTKETDTTI